MTFDADAFLALMAPAMGLAVDPQWRPHVTANLAATARMATLVLEFPLEQAEEPAPVFVA